METVAVCLYSKYSQRCNDFLADVDPQLGVHKLCIDNTEVRQTLLKDEQGYNVRTVPCIFLFYPNGRLEKYEGSDAFTWLRKVKELLYQQPPQPQQPPPPQSQQTPIQQLKTVPQSQPQFEPPQPQQQPQFEPPQQPQFDGPLDITPIEENGIQGGQQNLEDIMNQEMELRRASDQVITRKQENIKELAQMMQRQRENDDDKIAPPPLYPKDANNRY